MTPPNSSGAAAPQIELPQNRASRPPRSFVKCHRDLSICQIGNLAAESLLATPGPVRWKLCMLKRSRTSIVGVASRLEVVVDGRGPAPDEAQSGQGIIGMRERAALVAVRCESAAHQAAASRSTPASHCRSHRDDPRTSLLVVLVAWTVIPLALGAWRTVTRDA